MTVYESTRGAAPRASAKDAILKGIADDGGLYVPSRVPRIKAGFLERLVAMYPTGYAEAAQAVMKPYLDDFSDGELSDCINGAYGGESRFDSVNPAPLAKLDDGVYALELFHGPTCAFKDMALQFLPRAMAASANKNAAEAAVAAVAVAAAAAHSASAAQVAAATSRRGGRASRAARAATRRRDIAILVATSGDTGKAALEGFRDVPGVRVLVFYPLDGVSDIQRLQMVSQEGGNVAVCAVRGNFDQAQKGVKAIFGDAAFNARLRALRSPVELSSANSINWGRLVPQIAYYFWAYAGLVNSGAIDCGDGVRFVVPTGNFGNILAGWYAREMGLPISRLICASNSNDVLADFISTGVYDRNREFHTTISPSMDILVSSNLERLLFLLSDNDAERVRGWMNDLATAGRFDVGETILEKIKSVFAGAVATEAETRAAIKRAYVDYGYVMDPHTAVGFHALSEIREADAEADAGARTGAFASNSGGSRTGGAVASPITLVSTASPYKFADDVFSALSDIELTGDAFAGVDALERLTGTSAPAPIGELRGKPELRKDVSDAAEADMKEAAYRLIAALDRPEIA